MTMLELSPEQLMRYQHLKQYQKITNSKLNRENRESLNKKVMALLEAGKHPKYISSECRCSIVTVYKIRKMLSTQGIEMLGGVA